MKREDIFRAIEQERARQDELHPLPKKPRIEDESVRAVYNMVWSNEFLAILMEEVGEVASAFQGDGNIKEELIQVASVAVRFLEVLE